MKGHMGLKNKAPFGHTDGTHSKIEKHMRKHKGRKKLTVVGPHLGHKEMHKSHESKAKRKRAARKRA